MRTITLCTVALFASASALTAQTPRTAIEVRPFAGANIPTGSQRDLFKDAPLFGISPAYQISPNFHIVGSFAWMPEKTRYQVANNNVDLFQYDVGVEVSLERAMTSAWSFRPFVGIGAGARTYAYESSTLQDRTCAAGYGSLGMEFRTGPTAIRVEGRDNLFCYKSPVAGAESETRNDLFLAVGLAYHLW